MIASNRRHDADLRAQQPKRLRQRSWTRRPDLADARSCLRTHSLEHVAKPVHVPRLAMLTGTRHFQDCRCQRPRGALAAAAGDGDEGDVIEAGPARAAGVALPPLFGPSFPLRQERGL